MSIASIEQAVGRINLTTEVVITHLVLSPTMQALVDVLHAYEPLSHRRFGKRASRRLRGRMRAAVRRASA